MLSRRLILRGALLTGAFASFATFAPGAQAADALKVGVLIPGSKSDKGWMESSYDGLMASEKKYGDKIKVQMSGTEYKARHILVAKEADAKDIIAKLKKEPKAFEALAKQKSLAVHVKEYPSKLIIQGDRHRFGQVLTNIISNAIKFTRAGSITVRTLLQPAQAGTEDGSPAAGAKHVIIEIEDTGIGISKEFIPHLFEEFRQEHAGATKEFGGTGLGLTISRRLVSLMGGTIQVRSQQGVGTVFSVVFPLVAEGRAAKMTETTANAVISTLPAAPKAAAQPTNGALVLVVEDNAETQRLLEAYLEGQYRIAQAMSAQEVDAAMLREVPDAIIMDINLPGRDGLALTREIRSGTRCPNVPIIALTAFAMTGDRQKCLDAGCDFYLSKPATRREVLDVVAKALAETHITKPTAI